MPLFAKEFHLSPAEFANINTASVAATILARLSVGPMCDHFDQLRVSRDLRTEF